MPGLADLVVLSRVEMADGLSRIIHAYRHMEISHPDTHRFTATLERVAPYMSTFIDHSGMPGNTNDI